MPLPEGEHRNRYADERVAWRENHADMIEWLAGQTSNAFLSDMNDNIRYYGWLTDNQYAACERARSAQDLPLATPMAADATIDDATNIFNGVYTINDGSQHITYRIHSVQRGPLAGKRIIKVQQGYDDFRGFAFLTADGHVKVWRRFAEDERRNERYIVWASILMMILRDRMTPTDVRLLTDNNTTFTPTIDDVQWQVQASATCRRCNRPLTNPSSIDAGLGPECSQRVNDRTVAARQRESVEGIDSYIAASPVQIVPGDNFVDPNTGLLQQVPISTPDDDPAPVEPAPLPYPTEAMLTAARQRDRMRQHRGEDDQREFRTLLGRMNWSDRERCCGGCGRLFASRAGVSRHRHACSGLQADANMAVRAEAERVRAANAARVAAGPNLSALGTRIGGEVWAQ